MICPHCKREFKFKADDTTKKQILLMAVNGVSLRDSERILRSLGKNISYSTIGRIIRDFNESKGK